MGKLKLLLFFFLSSFMGCFAQKDGTYKLGLGAQIDYYVYTSDQLVGFQSNSLSYSFDFINVNKWSFGIDGRAIQISNNVFSDIKRSGFISNLGVASTFISRPEDDLSFYMKMGGGIHTAKMDLNINDEDEFTNFRGVYGSLDLGVIYNLSSDESSSPWYFTIHSGFDVLFSNTYELSAGISGQELYNQDLLLSSVPLNMSVIYTFSL